MMAEGGNDGSEDTSQAFEAHAAMMRTQSREKILHANPFWRVAREGAFARFLVRFRRDGGADGR